MPFTFRPAVRENAPVLIMLAGPSGGGKTKTALRLAEGLANGGKIAGIDTEAGRMTHYADQHKFDHGDMKPPFAPAHYLDAIEAADKAGYAVVIIDSASHEWAGDGGCLDLQDAELDRMAGQDWGKRERVKMAAWIKPKMEHKRMMSRLLQCRCHVILCFRAEEKVEIRKDEKGKQQIIPIGFQPICEKNMPYEATVSFLLADTKTHLPTPIKLQDQHKAFFPLDKPIGEDAGKKLAAWAKGGKPAERVIQEPPEQTQPATASDIPWPKSVDAPRKEWIDACAAAVKEIQAIPNAALVDAWQETHYPQLQMLMQFQNDLYLRLGERLADQHAKVSGSHAEDRS